jgi:transposase
VGHAAQERHRHGDVGAHEDVDAGLVQRGDGSEDVLDAALGLGPGGQFWVDRWRACLPPPPDATARAARLGRSVARWRALAADITAAGGDLTELLAGTEGQILTTLPGVATCGAAAFAAFSLPITRFPSAEHLYWATGLVISVVSPLLGSFGLPSWVPIVVVVGGLVLIARAQQKSR